MCGIAGIVNANNPLEIISKLSTALTHRGPDEQSHYTHQNISLIHTRLAIQDIQHGQQPMHMENCAIIFNGQIYNHLSLRKQYLSDISFSTQSDTETLLALYLKFGPDMFQYMDGMFAFAILDKNKRQLFLARDRAGKKPLYYFHKNAQFVFASELNALKSIMPLSIRHEAIEALLRCGFLFKQFTPFADTQELTAGSYLTLDLSTLHIEHKKYFDLLSYYQQPKIKHSLEDTLTLVDDTLKNSVNARLFSSELEVGAFLSGGIDSSLIVAMAAQQTAKLKTFTIKFPGSYDESALAKLTAERYGTAHTEIDIHMNVAEDLEKILLNYGEPFLDSSAIPSYYVAREAKKHVTVVLNGDGADELFGGYRRYVPMANQWLAIAARLSWLINILPSPHNKKTKYNYLYRLLAMSNKTGLDFYLSSTTDTFDDCYNFKNNWIDQQLNDFILTIEKSTLSSLDKMLYLDFSLILFSDLLPKMDIATMAHSLEARSPFLSKDMMILAARLPDNQKIHRTTTKFILRELAKKYLPNALVHQPKRGFEIPLKSWLDHELKDKMLSYLDGTPKVSHYIKNDFIQKLLKKKIITSDEKRAKMLWALLTTEIWLQHN